MIRPSESRDAAGKTPETSWECLHVCVDDASRFAYTTVHADETAESSIKFLWNAMAWCKCHDIKVKRVLMDNGACYKSWKFRHICQELGIQHKLTRPYHLQANGKAERFIRTILKEWAYACTYTHSRKQTQDLPISMYRYNFQCSYMDLGRPPPASRPPRVGTTS